MNSKAIVTLADSNYFDLVNELIEQYEQAYGEMQEKKTG